MGLTGHDIICILIAACILITWYLVFKHYLKPTITKRIRKIRKYFQRRIMAFKKHRRMRKASKYAHKQVQKLLKKFKMND